MECPHCDGSADGCEHCEYGRMKITCCPMLLITPDIAELLELTDLMYNGGVTPVTGGALDQAAYFITAARLVMQAKNRLIQDIRNKKKNG